jgi:hypothetical protein
VWGGASSWSSQTSIHALLATDEQDNVRELVLEREMINDEAIKLQAPTPVVSTSNWIQSLMTVKNTY